MIAPLVGVEPGFLFGASPARSDLRYPNPQNRHTGVDFFGVGEVVAVAPGRVTVAGWGSAYGYWTHVRDEHTGQVWVYAYLRPGFLAKVGQRVNAGTPLGEVEPTPSRYATQPHVHLELSRGRSWAYNDVVDPLERMALTDA